MAIPQEFVVSDLIRAEYDVYTLLFYLNHKSSHDGVRDFLTHRLYSCSEEDIELILPQLCHLYMVWSPARCGPLGDYFIHAASTSIHFTLRTAWTFRAQIAHCASPRQRECMERLIASCEMALVNQSVFGPDGRMRKNHRSKPERRSSRTRNTESKSPRSSRESSRDSSPSKGGSRSRSLTPGRSASAASPEPSPPAAVFRPTPPTPADVPATAAAERTVSPPLAHQQPSALAALPHPHPLQVHTREDTPAPAPMPSPLPSPSTIAEAARIVAESDGPSSSSAATAAPPSVPFVPAFPVAHSAGLVAGAKGGGILAPLQGVIHVVDTVFGIGGNARVEAPAPVRAEHSASLTSSSSSLSTSTSAEFTVRSSSASPPQGDSDGAASSSLASASTLANPLPLPGPMSSPRTHALAAAEADAVVSSVLSAPGSSASSSSSSSSSFACSPEHAASIDELYLLASAQVRSDYFHALQRMIEEFASVSEGLVTLPQASRSKRLRRRLREMDPKCRGLYFPTTTSTPDGEGRHYRLLRFLPDDSFILNSRDKAPFLFHVEVQWAGGAGSVHDRDIFLAYRSREEITADVMQLHHCEACRSRNATTLAQIAGAASRRAEMAVDDSTRVHSAPSNPNPAALVQSAQSQAHSGSAASSAEDHPSVVLPEPTDDGSGGGGSSLSVEVDSPRDVRGSLRPPPLAASSRASSTGGGRESAASTSAEGPLSVPNAKRPSVVHVVAPSSSPIAAAGSFLPSPALVRPVAQHQSAFDQLAMQAFGESFTARKARIQSASRFHASMPQTDVLSMIFKHGDDVRQEVLAMQIIQLFQAIFSEASLPLFLRPYCVLITSANSGLIETVTDSISIDSLKKNVANIPNCGTFTSFFHYYFSLQGEEVHERALNNFVESLAAYSVLSFLLQIKDRHNGNLLLTREGHLVHIDFGFILANSPGGNVNFEAAPFKLTAEFVEVMGGEGSSHFQMFKLLVIRGYLESRKHAYRVLLLLEVLSKESQMACWAGNPEGTLHALKQRFNLDLTEEECVEFAYSIVEQSINNWRTVQYDNYQRITNGIV